MPILLKNQTSDQLHASLAHAGVSPHLARRLLAAAVKRGETARPGQRPYTPGCGMTCSP